jgi:hypothetical protein
MDTRKSEQPTDIINMNGFSTYGHVARPDLETWSCKLHTTSPFSRETQSGQVQPINEVLNAIPFNDYIDSNVQRIIETSGHRFLTTLAAGGNDNPFVQSESLAGIIFRGVYVLIQTNRIIGRPASRISGVVATTTMALEIAAASLPALAMSSKVFRYLTRML